MAAASATGSARTPAPGPLSPTRAGARRPRPRRRSCWQRRPRPRARLSLCRKPAAWPGKRGTSRARPNSLGPVTTSRLARDDEVDAWREDGWVVLEGLIGTDEIDAVAGEIAGLFPTPAAYHADPE